MAQKEGRRQTTVFIIWLLGAIVYLIYLFAKVTFECIVLLTKILIFLVVAAAQFQPSQAKGVDATLRAFAHTPLGPWLLALVAAGLVMFGVYSFCETRWRQV